MTRGILATLLFLSTLSYTIRAQRPDGDNLGEITFEELKDKEKSSQYFAVGGGFVGNFLFFDENAINSNLPQSFNIGGFKGPMFVSGGQGFITFFFKNIRFGFSAAIGTNSVSNSVIKGADTVTRNVDLSSSFNGLTVEYAVPLLRGLTVLPGLQGGLGNLVLDRYDGVRTSPWMNIRDTSLQPMARLETSHWYVQPTLNIEYALTTFTMVRLSAGYALTLPSKGWKLNRTTEVSDAPSGLKTNGFVAGFGVYFGLFRNE